ncbi:MAG: hypothetical protein ABIG65_02860 [Patescibacteria group bacterium]
MAKKSAKKSISPQELEKMRMRKEIERRRKSKDLSHFWEEVIEKALPGIEAYRIARAKSKAQAASTVFI